MRAHVFEVGDTLLHFRAKPGADFDTIVWANFAESMGRDVVTSIEHTRWWWGDPEWPTSQIMLVPNRGLTVRDVSRLLGSDVRADPPRLSVGYGGLGGGPWSPTVVELIGYAQMIWPFYMFGRRWSNRIRFGASRAAARDWVETGEPSMVLEQLVRAEPRWRVRAVMRTFGLPLEGASALMRLHGYVRSRPGLWVEPDPDSEP